MWMRGEYTDFNVNLSSKWIQSLIMCSLTNFFLKLISHRLRAGWWCKCEIEQLKYVRSLFFASIFRCSLKKGPKCIQIFDRCFHFCHKLTSSQRNVANTTWHKERHHQQQTNKWAEKNRLINLTLIRHVAHCWLVWDLLIMHLIKILNSWVNALAKPDFVCNV